MQCARVLHVCARVCVCSRFKVKWKNRISSHAYIQLARSTRGQFEDQVFFPSFLYTWFFLFNAIFLLTVYSARCTPHMYWMELQKVFRETRFNVMRSIISVNIHTIEFRYIYFHPCVHESERLSKVGFLYRIKNGVCMQKQTLLFWPVLVIYIIVCTCTPCHTLGIGYMNWNFDGIFYYTRAEYVFWKLKVFPFSP